MCIKTALWIMQFTDRTVMLIDLHLKQAMRGADAHGSSTMFRCLGHISYWYSVARPLVPLSLQVVVKQRCRILHIFPNEFTCHCMIAICLLMFNSRLDL